MTLFGWTDFKPRRGRKTFATMADEAEINEHAYKLQMGHYIDDITKKHYIVKNMTKLKTEIFKLP